MRGGFGAVEGADSGQVEVVVNPQEFPHPEFGVDGAHRGRQDESPDADGPEEPDAEDRFVGGPALVEVVSSEQRRDRERGARVRSEFAHHQSALVSGRGARREPGNLPEGQGRGLRERASGRRKTRAQHDPDPGEGRAAAPVADDAGRKTELRRDFGLHGVPVSMPAMAAVTRVASVPPARARRPRRARSFLRPGAIAPMPPI